MDNLISPTQNAYTKGRYIMDDVVYAHETLHTIFFKKKLRCVLFKLDFEKSFDRVNWDFILDIMQGRNFGISG
jgi:Reverse transcriptase (RNA-dependent DNA polymerase)